MIKLDIRISISNLHFYFKLKTHPPLNFSGGGKKNIFFGGPSWDRTKHHLIMSQVL
jgi:hypothetical protein